jgi:hypothetical protein
LQLTFKNYGLKNKKKERKKLLPEGYKYAQVEEHLPSKHEALSMNPITSKKKKKKLPSIKF